MRENTRHSKSSKGIANIPNGNDSQIANAHLGLRLPTVLGFHGET